MKEESEQDQRIETIIARDGLPEAFRRFNDWMQQFDQLQLNVAQLQGRLANVQRENSLGTLAEEALILESNRVRHALLAELQTLKTMLPEYLDTTQPELLMRGVQDQVQIAYDVLSQRLRGFYDIERQISEGNSALVYLLRDIFTGRQVVAKVLKMPSLTDEIREEIRNVSQLKHRNIIKLLGESLDRFPFYVICEYVNGVTLPEALEKTGPRPPSQAVDWLFQLAEALGYLRQKRIAHTNIRPSKIYLDEEQHVMISPFDIIKAGRDDRTLRKFREDCLYLSPELMHGDGERVDYRAMRASDQFSIGLVAYRILTGRDLFGGDSVQEILQRRERFFNDARYRRAQLEALPTPEWRKILEKMLQQKPEHRYADLYEVLNKFRKLNTLLDQGKTLVRDSYRRCLAQNPEFIAEFYDHFFANTGDEHKPHFTNRGRQHTMLQMAIDVLIDLDTKKPILQKILGADSHTRLSPAAYEKFLDLFIETVQQNDRRGWNEATAQAWQALKTKALTVIQEALPATEKPA